MYLMQFFVILLYTCQISLCFASNVPKYIRCDYEYFEDANGWLKYHRFPATWSEAMETCYQEGAFLASPTNLTSTPMMCIMEKQRAANIFTGINDLISPGIFTTLEGGLADDYNVPHIWAVGEPNNAHSNERCVTLDRMGELADVDCSLKLPYICYRKKTIVDNDRNCNTFNDGYFFNGGSCHKLHTSRKTYAEAFKTCHTEGGYLSIINNEDERQIVERLVNKTLPADYATSVYLHYIGFHDVIMKKGVFRTVKGQTFEELGFSKFKPGEPNNENGNEYCGTLYRKFGSEALLNDATCDESFPFVCEVDVIESCQAVT